MKKFTRYAGQYINLDGHNFMGVDAINRDADTVLLHQGCPCNGGALLVFPCGESLGPDDFGITARFDIGVDDENVAYCTIYLAGPGTDEACRMEELEGVKLQ